MELLSSSSEESASYDSYEEDQPLKFSKENSSSKVNESKKPVNYINASFFSRLFFTWSKFAIDQAKKKKLSPNQISTLDDSQTTAKNLKETSNYWKNFKEKGYKYPLLFGLFFANLKRIIICFFMDIVILFIEYFNMFLQNRIVSNFSSFDAHDENRTKFINNTILCVVSLLLGKVGLTVMYCHWDFLKSITSERVTNEASALIYKKILVSNTNANVNSKEDGEKLNLVQEDCERIGFLFVTLPRLIIFPTKIIISMTVLFKLFGAKFFYCLISLFIAMGLFLLIQHFVVLNYKTLLAKKDMRMKEVVNTLQSIKQVKMNGMDDFFMEKIFHRHDEELKYQQRNKYLEVLRNFVSNNLSVFLKVVIISLQIYDKTNIEVSTLFAALSLIKSVAFPFLYIPSMLTGIIENLISIERIQDFLNSPEHDYTQHKDDKAFREQGIIIKYDEATFGITIPEPKKKEKIKISEQKPLKPKTIELLKNITIEIKKGEFIGVVGQTGSGKTCLINSILNNYELFSSKSPIIVNGSISFEPQQPLIVNDTVKNNILFDAPFDAKRYNEILNCCQLSHDIENFDKNDSLKLALNGTNVSGGQKARIALARCVYRDTDVYLLDDPLSSIDSKNTRKITQHLFMEYLKDKTRILAVNEPTDIKIFDKLIFMEHGEVKFFGTPKEFDEKFGNKITFVQKKGKKAKRKKSSINKNDFNENEEEEEGSENERKEQEEREKMSKKLKKYNNMNQFSYELYHKYIKLQGGYILFIGYISLIFFKEFCRSKNQTFTASWSKTSKQLNRPDKVKNIEKKEDFWQNFKMFLIVNFMELFSNFILDFAKSSIMIKITKTLFISMITHLIRAPINLFLDVIPIGHIINRLTNDSKKVRKTVYLINYFILQLFTLIVSGYLCYQYNKYSLVIAPAFFIAALTLAKSYLPSMRGLERLHRTTFAPVTTKFTEAIKGVETIRTLGNEEPCTRRIFKRLDTHLGVHLYIEGADKHFLIYLNMLVHLFYCIEISYLVFHIEEISAQQIGLLLQQLQIITKNFIYIIRTYKDLQIIFVCLERCDAYSQIESEKIEGEIKIKGEGPVKLRKTPKKHIEPIEWPTKGRINFKNYTVKYRENLPNTLNKVNLEIQPGEKMGVVGRTGSGKSTLILGLCRIIEANEGNIFIDGVDISKINLMTLRNSLTVVSQDPFLIEGTLRQNIDPFYKHKDEKLIEVLNDFQIFPKMSQEKRLNFHILTGGSNISAGEKQLICFVKASLTNNKIVIMDEATASMDTETEKIMQDNMSKYFKNKTMIIIAHHIQMVVECDRIAVVDNGEIVECDTFENLFKNKEGKFHELYEENLALLK